MCDSLFYFKASSFNKRMCKRILRGYFKVKREMNYERTTNKLLNKNLLQNCTYNPKFFMNTERNNKVLFLAHMSLPYDSAGYATRTHSLLANLPNKLVDSYTRLGYPFDIIKSRKKHQEVHEGLDFFDGVSYGGVDYSKLLNKEKNQITLNRDEYILEYANAILSKIKSEGYGLIHANSDYRNGMAAAISSKISGIPYIYEVRGLWHITKASKNNEYRKSKEFQIYEKLEIQSCQHASKVIALTSGIKSWLINKGIEGSKIEVIPNGINTDHFTVNELNACSSKKLTIGYIGSFVKYEGLPQLIDVAKNLIPKFKNIRFLLVGDGEDYQSIKQLIKTEGLEEFFELPGRVPFEAVEGYYEKIDIFVYPRLPVEVCELVSPLKPFEAMYKKKAIVASDVAAQQEFIIDGYNGRLHKKGDVESISDVIGSLILDENLRKKMGEQAHHWVIKERKWNDLAKQVENIYSQYLK